MTTQQVGGDGWDDEVMIARWRNAFGASPDVHEWAYLCWLRDDLRQTIATQAAKIAQVQADNERLRAELAEAQGDDWGKTVDYLISLAPEPEPPLPEPPDDWDDDDGENNPHYDTPGGY